MDFSELAIEMMDNMQSLRKEKPQKNMEGALRGESFVLHYIASNGEVLPGEIGDEMNVSTARIAQTLNSIEKKGWIIRQIDPNDRRKILVKLTPAGKSIADEQYQTAVDIATRMLTMLGEDDAKEYVRITGKLVDIISKMGYTHNPKTT